MNIKHLQRDQPPLNGTVEILSSGQSHFHSYSMLISAMPEILPSLLYEVKLYPFSYVYNSRTSVARTLMARLPWLFQTRSWVPWKKSHSCRFGIVYEYIFIVPKVFELLKFERICIARACLFL